jgi:plasmid stabilization system protein ParE
MSRRIILSPDAEADIRSAVRWYLLREESAALRFRTEIQTECFDMISRIYKILLLQGNYPGNLEILSKNPCQRAS